MVAPDEARPEVDLRRPDWPVRDQGSTGACVGFAAADGVLHWHYWKAGLLPPGERPSPRFIWMANKETDRLTDYPTTFIESAGTQTKRALRVARRYGCVLDSALPMDGGLSPLRATAFYTMAAKYRIASYHNLRRNRTAWRRWLSNQGPILARVAVDRTWRQATRTHGELAVYRPDQDEGGGHAICLVGFTADTFIVRNSWGAAWGDRRLRLRLRAVRSQSHHRGLRRRPVATAPRRHCMDGLAALVVSFFGWIVPQHEWGAIEGLPGVWIAPIARR